MKMKKVFLSLGVSALMTANFVLPCSASSLSREELSEKYAHQLELGTKYYAYPNDEPGIGEVDVDENGIGEDGVEYGIEFANKTLLVYNDYRFTLYWDVRNIYFHGDFKEYEGIYYAVKPDQTVKLVGYNEPYFRELKPEKLELPAEIDGMPVNEIDKYAFETVSGRTGFTIKEIVVPDSVTIIRQGAFSSAFGGSLEKDCKINIPANVVYLGNACYDFLGFALGDEVVLPETVEFLNHGAFRNTYVKVVPPKSNFVSMFGFCISESAEPLVDYFTVDSIMYTIREPFGDNCIRPYPTERVEHYLSVGYDMDKIKEILNLPSEEPTPSEELQAQVPETAPTIEPEQTMLPGDLDANGEVNVIDAVAMARLVGDDPELELSEAGLSSSDYNGDGVTDALDLNDLMQYLAG